MAMDKPHFLGDFSNIRIRADGWNCIYCALDKNTEYRYNFNFQLISELTINAKLWNMPNNWTLPKIGDQTVSCWISNIGAILQHSPVDIGPNLLTLRMFQRSKHDI